MVKKNIGLLFFFILCVAVTLKVSMAMGLLPNNFERRWDHLSSDVQKLNEYTATRPVELRGVKVENKDLEGATFIGATFSGVEWQYTYLKKAKFTQTVFKDCKFIGSLHQGSIFTDAVFENCIFHSAEFGRSTFVNVRFKNCKITDSRFEDAKGNELIFEDSHLETRTSLAGSSMPMTFRHCTLKGVSLSGIHLPNKMTIEDSLLEEVDFSRSLFSVIVLRRVKQSGGGIRFNDLSAKSITFEDVDMTRGTAIARSEVGLVRVSGGNFGVAFGGSSIPRIVIRDAHLSYMGFAEARLSYVEIANCQLYDTGMWDGYIDEFFVKNSRFDIIDGENFKADIVLWDNVTLDGEINLTNAQVNDFRLSRLTRGPNLNLLTTGSNMRFD